MKNRFKLIDKVGILFITMASMLILNSCIEKDVYEPVDNETPSKEEFFDFSTTSTYTLDINYGLKNYPVLFELYAENPLTVVDDTYTKVESIRPFYRAATNSSGKFNQEIVLPAYVEKVYLYCSYIGTVRCAELSIDGNKITFDQKSYLTTKAGNEITTRATTGNKHTYPDGYHVLGDWSGDGRPDYLVDGLDHYTGDFLAQMTHSFIKSAVQKDGTPIYPSADIKIAEPTKLSCTIIASQSNKAHTLCYYTYPTNMPPASPADIKNPVIVFPAVAASNVTVNTGDEVALRYWNAEKGTFEDEFPAGVSLGFFFFQEGLDNKGNIGINKGNSLEGNSLKNNVDYIFYSNSTLNNKLASIGKTDAQRAITVYDGNHLAAMCFESDVKGIPGQNGSWDYIDIVIAIYIPNAGSIVHDLPELPSDKEEPKDEDNYVDYWGTLAFEDLWPSQGDYDMNDVGMYYESIIYKDVTNNNVIKIVDKFYTAHKINGASKANAFGYQFHKIANSAISSVSIETDSGLSTPGLENGQEHPTIIVFENGKDAAKEIASFTVTTIFNGGVLESDVRPPYNPFIIESADQGRGTEVHLTNYPPTKLANTSLFGDSDDKSNPSIGLYYVSNNNFPFAIHLSHAYLELPAEGVRIDKVYPDFAKWAESKGTSSQNWYVK